MNANELWSKGDRCQHKGTLELGTVRGTSTVFVDVEWDGGKKELITYSFLQDPIEKYDWEPMLGFCSFNRNSNVELAHALELLRRRICAYNWGLRDEDARCDCKYGLTADSSIGSEHTGCPELRELIYRLLHAPESFGENNA